MIQHTCIDRLTIFNCSRDINVQASYLPIQPSFNDEMTKLIMVLWMAEFTCKDNNLIPTQSDS